MRLEVPRRGLDPGPSERIAAHVLAQRGVHCLGRVELPTGDPRGEDTGDEIASAAERLLGVERQLVRGRFAVAHVPLAVVQHHHHRPPRVDPAAGEDKRFRERQLERVQLNPRDTHGLELPFAEPFILSGGRIDARRSVVVVLHDGEGHVGYGESAPDELPFYSGETLGSARDLIPRVLAPRIAGKEFDSPEAVDAALRENVRGNPFARAGIETAAWDLEAHRRGTGLPQLVAERLGVAPAASFPCGVALGIPEDRRAETLTRRVYEALQHGYQRVKIKVAPQWDEVAVRAARV